MRVITLPAIESYPSVEALLDAVNPAKPVYCIYPHVYKETAEQFLQDFPGRVLYAIKACSEPAIVEIFVDTGIRHFDCASLAEIEIVKSISNETTCYFMVPVRIRGEARIAQSKFGVRHFLIDHESGIEQLKSEVDVSNTIIFARMAVHHPAATWDLSTKFGAPASDIPGLLTAIAETGAEPALAFNVGSSVTDPAAYRDSIESAAGILESVPMDIRLVDVGGGYPRSYPDFEMPPLNEYFDSIRDTSAKLPLADNGEILGEPGRAMAGPGLSAVSEVLQRKDDKLYLNDGMHGIFWELRYIGHSEFPCRTFRGNKRLDGNLMPFTLFGPTCDSADVLPSRIQLPDDIRPGDYLEFGRLGAYSLTGRSDFNGCYSDHIVMIDDPEQFPPGHHRYRN